jgi:hypothetical protein
MNENLFAVHRKFMLVRYRSVIIDGAALPLPVFNLRCPSRREAVK